MRIKKDVTGIVLMLALSLAFTWNGEALAYTSGFTWDRFNEYSTASNPNKDGLGNEVWSYEWFTGMNYANTQQMTQIASWGPRWEQGPVNISGWDQNSNYNSGWNTSQIATLIRWLNPVGDNASIDVDGDLILFWGGTNYGQSGYVATPVEVRFIFGFNDVSENRSDLLIDQYIDAPFTGEQACAKFGDCPKVTIPLDLTISMDSGDSFFWTAIAMGQVNANRWTTLNDNSMIVTSPSQSVPEPGTMMLLGAGMVVLIGIRRNKK